MMDNCFTRCFSYYVKWQVQKLQTKKLPFITWFITSHLDVYNSMEHAHPSERCTHSTYICGSHIESSSNQKKFYANSMSMASVSPYIYAQSQQTSKAIQPPSILWRMGKWKQTHKCCSYQLLFKYWIPWTDVNGRTSFCLPVEKKNIPYNRSQLLSRLYHLKSAYIYIICCNYDSCLTQNNLQKGLNPKRKRNILLIFCWNCLKIENHIGLLLQNAQHKMYFAYIYIYIYIFIPKLLKFWKI
jgi:hypothetical protein